MAGPGETLVVPIGVPHSEWNPGSIPVEGSIELRPALHTKEMFEAFGGLGSEGKTTARGAPKNPLQLGATLWHFRHESRATSPPIWLQNLLLPALATLAKVFGVRPTTSDGTAGSNRPAVPGFRETGQRLQILNERNRIPRVDSAHQHSMVLRSLTLADRRAQTRHSERS